MPLCIHSEEYKYEVKEKSILKQISMLKEIFVGPQGFNYPLLRCIENGDVKLPPKADVWLAIPNRYQMPQLFGKTDGEALETVLDALEMSSEFKNYVGGPFDHKNYKESLRTKRFFAELSREQGNPGILIVPAQLGRLHQGISVKKAIKKLDTNEFPLGSFASGIVLLTHPDRLKCQEKPEKDNSLWLDSGDEYSPESNSEFSHNLHFNSTSKGIGFSASGINIVCGRFGLATGFRY